ncbi:MAG TPA: hypothetical protein VGB57_06015 [Allosphingosinicella sp.]|jgi:hypothetical protein
MSSLAPRLAAILLALGLTLSGVSLGASGSAPTLPDPIAPFGCYA